MALIPLAGVVFFQSSSNRLASASRHHDCLALEKASPEEIEGHRAGAVPALQGTLPTGEPSRVLTISDPPGGAVRSLFTTSQYSYAEAAGPARRPGGGQVNVRLRVGGWGDTYLTLIQFPVQGDRAVRRALLRLVVMGDQPGAVPTSMVLRQVAEPWFVGPGYEQRLWWRDCPRTVPVRTGLPAPAGPDSAYDVDITDLYNGWVRGASPNYGLMLEPEHIGVYGQGGAGHPHFTTFYSTRAVDPANRPKLILYE